MRRATICRHGLPLLLMLVYMALGMSQVTHASITFDEGPHLAIGYATLRTGDFRLQPVHIHPPLANVLAAAPLLLQSDLPDPRSIDGWEIASLSAITDGVVWQYAEPARIATAGRVPLLLLSVLLGALIYRWAQDLGGWRAGLLALALYTFDPNCIAHSALITTDMPVVFFSVATLYGVKGEGRRANQHSMGRLVAMGVLLGLAQLTKVSALMLVPVVGLLLLVQAWQQNRHNSAVANDALRMTNDVSHVVFHVLRAWVMVFGVAAVVVWAGYGFQVGYVPGFPFPLPAATHIRIFQSLREHYELGHPTFLMGQVSNRGWWWYFPVAFVLKTPLPVLILAVGTAVRFTVKCFHVFTFSRFQMARWIGRWLPVFLFPLLYAISSLLSSVNIGYRHLLPLLPFLYVGIGVGSMKYGVRSRNRQSRTGSGSLFLTPYSLLLTPYFLLLAWLAMGTIVLAPHFLTFFNEFAGGARGGYRYLVDSNLDWGQNLWDLQQWMTGHGEDHIDYAHYSPARLDVYGIDADFLPPDPRAVAFAPWNPAPGLYAIGATVLQGPYAPDINTYAWFRTREPLARLGHALWLYRVSPREAPAWAALCTGVSLSAETVEQRLGVHTLRVVQPDCAQAFIYPASRQAGVIIASPGAEPPPMSQVDVILRSPTGEAGPVVYRLSGMPPVPASSAEGIDVDGPLEFLGYTLHANTVVPDSEIVLQTFWRVREVPGRPLSLMAHLLGPEGTVVAVGDGMGFPIEQWQPGDGIVQRHVLAVPADARPGTYTVITGAYWLDTLERWGMTDASGRTDDALLLYRFERHD
ncbi:MAG TPA: phospholipid carrier-dependent glycosyltransferase [Anaerolineae bacterium]|nr:phospholipid carrier-dependent glycosyltransferase [Anaerolineae bacterium]HQH37227.1 phospholipid carrier-dependent glycosyltransferase [Anaerolineae bacterium]